MIEGRLYRYQSLLVVPRTSPKCRLHFDKTTPSSGQVPRNAILGHWDFKLAKDNFREPDFTGPGVSPPSAANEDLDVAR
jgi:hypothetical protein